MQGDNKEIKRPGFFINASTSGKSGKVAISMQESCATFSSEDQQTYGTVHSERNIPTVNLDGVGKNVDVVVKNSGPIIVADNINGVGNLEFFSTTTIKANKISAEGDVSMIMIADDVDPKKVEAVMSFLNKRK